MKERLVILGTGHAHVVRCFNTCFIMQNDEDCLLVDAGGGNGILTQLDNAGFALTDIDNLFLSHKHTDHILGAVWLVRLMACDISVGRRKKNFYIYGNQDVIDTLSKLCRLTLQEKYLEEIGVHIYFHTVKAGDTLQIGSRILEFFDIYAVTVPQLGFKTVLSDGQEFVFCGDEPFAQSEMLLKDADWVIHEATYFVMPKIVTDPHTCVEDACLLAKKNHVKNLIVLHMEDEDIINRKEKYLKEGKKYYDGGLYFPDDLDVIALTGECPK